MKNHRAHTPSADSLGIGERLRNAREARGLTLSALEAITHIRSVYLQSLEEERFDRLPGRVYTRGFLRTYAEALGLDPDELVQVFPQAFELSGEPLLGSYPVEIPIRPTAPPSRLRRIFLYAGGVVILATVVLGIIGYQQLRQFSTPGPEVQSPAPSSAPPQASPPPQSVPEASPVEAPVEVRPAPPPPTPPLLPPPPPEAGIEIVIEARGTSWLRIVADGEQVFVGMIEDGDVRRWQASSELTVRVGRPSVLTVYVNGQPVATRIKPGRQVWEETFKRE